MGSSINIALPAIGEEFGMSAVLMSWVATSYLLSSALFLVPFGRIADIYGRKKVFFYGILIFTAASGLCAAAQSPAMLIALRVVQGLGSAMIFGTGVAILTSAFPAGERGRALGINVASVYLGLSLGPFLGGFLTQNLGWRSVFIANIPVGAVVAVLVLLKLKQEWAEAKGESFDLLGSVLYGIGLTATMYGFSLLPKPAGAWLIAGGIAGIVVFALWESKCGSPVLNVSLFKNNRVFVFSSIAALISYSATFAVGFLISLYLQYIKGMTPQQAGLILIVQPAIQTAFSPFAGRLSDRLEPRVVASTGMAFTVFGLFLLIFLTTASPMFYIMFSLALLGFGFALFSSPNTNAVMSSVERRFYGIASGILGTARLTGQMLSMGIAMLVFAVYIGGAQITPQYYGLFLVSVRVIFIILSILCTLAVYASYARGSLRKDEP